MPAGETSEHRKYDELLSGIDRLYPHRTFDFLKVMRYNDSVHNALYALQSTIQRKDESKESLSNANLMLTVERQEAQLTLLGCLLLLVIVGGGAFFYIRRRHRLIEAEERIETLNRLLADATKGDGEQELPEILIKKWKMDSSSERYFCNSWALYAWLLHNLHLKIRSCCVVYPVSRTASCQ